MRELSQSDDEPRATVAVMQAQQLELFEPEEIVRPDYNIGKYATFLFASPYLKDLAAKRRIEWSVPAPDGGVGEATAAIIIRPLHEQIIPTTTSFKVFMAVVQLWQMQNKPASGTVYFSDRQLAEVAGWAWSGVIANRIKEHLDILQGTSIDWEFSFQRKDHQNRPGHLERLVNKMHLLEEVTYLERRLTYQKERFAANQVVRINSTLVQNMLNGGVRPINFEALRQISSDASTRLYMMCDLYLAGKPRYERRAYELLVHDLGYQGKRYENRGERKRTLQRLIADIDGKELTNGKLVAELAATADGKDWKLIARKAARIKRTRKRLPNVLPAAEAERLADELLERFDGVPKAHPPKRGFLVFLCRHYPEAMLRDAVSRAKADYLGSVRKSVGAIFRYELEQQVRQRSDLRWYRD